MPTPPPATAIERDAATFGKLKQVVMMGGSVRTGYRKSQYVPARPADKEYNIASEVKGAQRLFTSGVPIVMMPVDSTQIRLDEVERNALLGHGSPVIGDHDVQRRGGAHLGIDQPRHRHHVE